MSTLKQRRVALQDTLRQIGVKTGIGLRIVHELDGDAEGFLVMAGEDRLCGPMKLGLLESWVAGLLIGVTLGR